MNHKTVGILFVLVTACGDSPEKSPQALDDSPNERWLFVQRTFTADQRQQYMQVLNELPSGKLDNKNALEIGGMAQFRYYGGHVYVSTKTDKSLTKYAIKPDGGFEQKGKLSFANVGISSPMPEFLSPKKAYVWNGAKAYAVNLETMEITTPQGLDFSAAFDGIPDALQDYAYVVGAHFSRPANVRGNLLFAQVAAIDYTDPTQASAYFPRARVLIIDVEKDELVKVIEDTRCMSDGDVIPVLENGDILVFGTAAQTFRTLFGDGQHSCMLKIPAGQTEFDPSFHVQFPSVLGGRHALEINYFKDGTFFIPAADPSRYNMSASSFDIILSNNPGRWTRFNLSQQSHADITGDGLDWLSPWSNAWPHSGRVFLERTRASAGNQSEDTAMYELDVATNRATQRFTFTGDCVAFYEVDG